MIRRRFLGLATLAGVGGLVSMEGIDLTPQATVNFRVTGFTCITCAVGLETLLQKERGVVLVKASYPANMATITYRPGLTSESALAEFIESAGFKASKQA